MAAERTHAYQRMIQTLKETGPSKLLGDEQKRIPYATNNLIFRRDLAQDAPARGAMADVERLCRALADSARWGHAAAIRLANDISRCGPTLLPALRAA